MSSSSVAPTIPTEPTAPVNLAPSKLNQYSGRRGEGGDVRVYRSIPRKVVCPQCGNVLEPPNDFVGDIWAESSCEECRAKNDARARKLLADAGLLAA